MYKLEKVPSGEWLIFESKEISQYSEILYESLELRESNQLKKFEKKLEK